ncbi:MAG: CDGSH iron-sulfur domain-containing protein [Calditrichaeota bacterium]|nr:CDGSH iron-sulfur domain-containing protein [Calditrichota bacterium]
MKVKSTETAVTIQPTENGSLAVTGLENLRDSRGEALPTKAKIYLCRCGGSNNKPFCDGSHKRNGFSGARESSASLDREKAYPGKQITVHDNRAICSHSERCVKELAAVFSKKARPWVNSDGASPEEIVALVKRCPSGALSYSIEGTQQRDFTREPQITVSKNGPYNVTGGIVIQNEIQPPSSEHYSLCRCGASKNKPFCDGMHHTIGFRDEQI